MGKSSKIEVHGRTCCFDVVEDLVFCWGPGCYQRSWHKTLRNLQGMRLYLPQDTAATDWLQSTHTDVGGIEAFLPTSWNKLSNILHVFLIVMTMQKTLLTYSLLLTLRTILTLSPLLWDPLTIVLFQLATSSFTPPPPIPPTQRHLWHSENARRADMSNFLLDFPWNDYCFRTRDPDLAATEVAEVVDSGMRAYIPYSLITFSPSNPWFDHACSSAISDRDGAHRLYQASPSELTHATFISAKNCCFAKIRRARSSFHKRKINKLNSSPIEKCFWSLSKKSSATSVTPAFPHLFVLMAL